MKPRHYIELTLEIDDMERQTYRWTDRHQTVALPFLQTEFRVHSVGRSVGLSVGLSVGYERVCIVEKRRTRSRCRLVWCVGWAKEITYSIWVQIPPGMGKFWGNGTVQCNE